MKIKHFVITRFLSSETLGLGDKIFDDQIIENGIDYVTKYFIPSMNNQTNKNFEIIFIINDKHDIENSSIKKLYDIDTSIKYHILKNSEYFKFCVDSANGYDWIILTRMDYDDLVKNTAVEEIQDIVAKNNNYDIICSGYNTGYIMHNETFYRFEETSYHNDGYFSIFESVCTNLNSTAKIKSIYSYTHTKLKNEIREYAKANGLKCMIYEKPKNCDNFVWVRHENTGTELLNGMSRFNNRLKLKCKKPENFKSLFGIE